MNTTDTDTDTAAAIRTALKAAGIPARAVSVKGSPGGSVRVRVLDVCAAPFLKVQAIAAKFESVGRCEATGEILGGGNTFVFVTLEDDAAIDLMAPHMLPGATFAGWSIYADDRGGLVAAKNGCRTLHAWPGTDAARNLAKQMAMAA